MIYLTGDAHGRNDWGKIFEFYNTGKVNEKDILIITGDFGAIWDGDVKALDKYNRLSCTICFVDGNHENFDLLYQYPIEIWNGGKVHRIRSNIYHLMRGEVFIIEGNTFFTFGGATSIDKEWRLEQEKIKKINGLNKTYKIWWEQEQPSPEEIANGFVKLKQVNYKVDYIITHTLDRGTMVELYGGIKEDTSLNIFLEYVRTNVKFKVWFCGHFHIDKFSEIKKTCILYNKIVNLECKTVYGEKRV